MKSLCDRTQLIHWPRGEVVRTRCCTSFPPENVFSGFGSMFSLLLALKGERRPQCAAPQRKTKLRRLERAGASRTASR